MTIDYFIIGQGLAGSVLAMHLHRAGKRIAVIDQRHHNTSSSVAAGLINPFTGPKMVKSWMFDELINYGSEYYKDSERILESTFFQERKIFKPFLSVAEQNDWYGKSTLHGYAEYIHRLCEAGEHASFVHDPYGGLEWRAWTLQVPVFLEAVYNYLKKNCHYLEETFDEKVLEPRADSVHYGDIKAKRVVFCTGYLAIYSRFFEWLPLVPVKGEMLEIRMAINSETIFNGSCFMIPVGHGYFRAGSTYDRSDMTTEPTGKGKSKIMENLHLMTELPFEVTGHWVGIRPGTITRRPLLGRHPEISSLFIFNGLGTKGVSLAPYFAREFVTHLEEGNNLPEEVDIKKYYSLYFKSQSAKKNNT